MHILTLHDEENEYISLGDLFFIFNNNNKDLVRSITSRTYMTLNENKIETLKSYAEYFSMQN